ncbi:MAG: hypothetical protein GYA24_20570 [Candidatus Lokiarchaeota archaeon]|nr:hypothetical protein [Candidatus Lokiarchaeota archaeon]
MPSIGILEKGDNILWSSSMEIQRYLLLVKYAISFAQNVRDGRLDEIGHIPYQGVDHLENHVMFIRTRAFQDKKDEIVLHFCLDYAESELRDKSSAMQLLDLFIDKILERVKIKGKFIEKISEDPAEFENTCDDAYREAMGTGQLMAEIETGLMLDGLDQRQKSMKLLFSAVSVQGLPIASNFYENMVSHFRITVAETEDAHSVLESLISAQLSTLSYESTVQGTSCTYLSFKFTDFFSFTERQLTVNFFPVTNDLDRKILFQDDFSFIIMSEGDAELAHVFQMSVTPLFAQTGLFNEKFSGNLTKYGAVKSLLMRFPRSLQGS